MRRWRKRVGGILAIYIFAVIAMALLQERLIFLPTTLEVDHVFSFDRPFEELFIDTEDGARLNGLYFPVNNAKGIILYYHGNSGDLDRWGEVVAYFARYNYDVLVMDYRTYGKSSGDMSEAAMYADAGLWYQKAQEYYPEEQIVLYGRSLGTAFASAMSAKYHPGQVILEAPFYSLGAVAAKRYWFLPVRWLLKYHFPSYQHLARTNAPVTLIHGTEDAIVPYDNSTRLKETLPQAQLKLVTISGGSHNDLIEFDAYHQTVSGLLSQDH